MSNKTQKRERILVAMSGGVDSSVAAGMLQEQGHDVVGAYMKNWMNQDRIFGECPWQEDIEDARAVAETLDIEFQVVNLMEAYKNRVVEYLLAGYREGVTPNPDVMCNREIKFGAFLEYAEAHGFDAVGTGHYARNRRNADGGWDMLEGLDGNKDQSYFLAMMHQHQVARARFPIGEMLKPEVRKKAEAFGLPNAHKKDSQGICFIGKVKMSDFLDAYMEEDPGPIVNLEGQRLGTHRGLHYYTFGQRKGIGVASNQYKENYVVVDKRQAGNELVVAFDRPETPRLYARECVINNLSYTNRPVTGSRDLLARPRYRAPAAALHLELLGADHARVTFAEPQRALTPGQICALYDGEVLLGGGVFESISYD